MAEVTRKSVMAVKKETTTGTIVYPTSGADYVALQDDVSMKPAFDTVDNNELSSSVGIRAAILGLEKPEFSFSHYVRHSGAEATDPSFIEFLEGAFGEKVAAISEFDTVAGSTAGTTAAAAVVNVDTGEGTNYERGKAILIKDPTNGYSIRNVHSVSSDALTLGFNLATAPGTGVNLGRPILLKPNDSAPTLSTHLYTGNGGAYQLMAGGRVSSADISVESGSPVNCAYSLAGVAYYFDPINITASTKYLDFTDDAGTHAAVVAVATYKDPHELAAALQQAIDDVTTTTPTVTYSNSTGKFTIKTTGTVLTLKWNTGTNTANSIATKIGFSTAADSSGTAATTGYTSATAQSWVSPYTPSADSNTDPVVVKAHEVMIGDFSDYGCAGVRKFDFSLKNDLVDVPDLCTASGIGDKLLSKRTCEAKVVLNLTRHDADKFRRFRTGADIRFAYNGGVKSAGNWIAGRCFNLYMPDAKITDYQITDTDSVVTIEITVQAYVKTDGLGEVFFNFL